MRQFFTFFLISLASVSAHSQTIDTYDIKNGRPTDTSPGWVWNYSGTITPSATRPGLYDYTGGRGTLNDGIIPQQHENIVGFIPGDNTVLTLHLSGTSVINEINFFSMLGTNVLAGNLSGATISYGGVSVALQSSDWGASCGFTLCNDRFSLANTALAGLSTDVITFSNFTSVAYPGYGGSFPVGEITLSGTVIPAVPEPANIGMLLAGLGLTGFMIRRRNRKA